jgi:iduronate 2-sulfatase
MKTLLSGFVILLCVTACRAAEKKNVLFIMTDDFRPELGCYGSLAITPNMDRLARRGVRFERAYCQQAVCNPSRSSMLTGLRPDTLGLWNNGTHFRELKPDVTTLPLWFKEHGYESRCVGKIFHNWHTKEKGDRRSWSADEFLHYANHGDDTPQVTGEPPPNTATLTKLMYGKVPLCESRDVPDEACYDGRVAAEAVKTISEIKGRAFFLAVGFWKPHAPFNAPKKYWDMYKRDQLPPLNPAWPEGTDRIAHHPSTEILKRDGRSHSVDAAQSAEMRHGYYANISYVDAQIGKVLDALEKAGLAENTIITLAGDHGYHIGEHEQWGKTSNFEHDAHVPLIISAPGSTQNGKSTRSLAELLDLFPTLVELCGLPASPQTEGVSLAPVLRDVSASVRPAAFTQHPRPAYYDRQPPFQPQAMGYSIRTDRVRYTEWRDWKSGEVLARELYDHESDEPELRNAIKDSHLSSALEDAQRQLSSRFPVMKH